MGSSETSFLNSSSEGKNNGALAFSQREPLFLLAFSLLGFCVLARLFQLSCYTVQLCLKVSTVTDAVVAQRLKFNLLM